MDQKQSDPQSPITPVDETFANELTPATDMKTSVLNSVPPLMTFGEISSIDCEGLNTEPSPGTLLGFPPTKRDSFGGNLGIISSTGGRKRQKSPSEEHLPKKRRAILAAPQSRALAEPGSGSQGHHARVPSLFQPIPHINPTPRWSSDGPGLSRRDNPYHFLTPLGRRLSTITHESPRNQSNTEGSLSSARLYSDTFVRGRHDFVVDKPNFNSPHSHSVNHTANDRSPDVLSWLERYVMPGAEYDSCERDPPPRCHPGTRTSIIKRAITWIEDSQRKQRGLWLAGSAGTGKSAIVQTLAERLDESQRLGATLFFSRPNGRSNPQQVFPTIAYQLALRSLDYRKYIDYLMRQNTLILDVDMSVQFQLLIVDAFVDWKIRVGQNDLLVAIDGLDECEGFPVWDNLDPSQRNRRRTMEEVHYELVQLVNDFIQKHPSVPLIWIISSRPEFHLKAVFSSEKVKENFAEMDIPVDEDEALRDVKKFLQASFATIRERYPEYFNVDVWPSHEQFWLIERAASGYFLFAAVITRFIQDPRLGNPISQLQHVVSAISNPTLVHQINPLAVLDAIYASILARIPLNALENTKKLLQVLIFVHHGTSPAQRLRFQDMYEYLDIKRENAITALRHLHSVIFFPGGKDNIDDAYPRLCHASFRWYLEDPSRSGQYSISKVSMYRQVLFQTHLLDMFGSIPDALRRFPKENGWSLVDSYSLLGRILRSKLSSSGTSVEFLSGWCTISDAEVRQIFERLSFKQMLSNNRNEVWDYLPLQRKEHCHVDELRHRQVLSITTLASLNIQAVRCVKKDIQRNFLLIDLDISMSSSHECDENSELYHTSFMKLLSDAPQTRVYVWGYRDGECCAVISEGNLPDFWNPHEIRVIYLIGF